MEAKYMIIDLNFIESDLVDITVPAQEIAEMCFLDDLANRTIENKPADDEEPAGRRVL
jgi:hypothetical protein